MIKMIKRTTGFFLAVLVLLACTAAAEIPVQIPEQTEPTATPGQIIFRFRDGIRWGMTPEQVKILEPEEMTERSRLNWTVMMTREKVAVSRFTADLLFMFRDSRLQIIAYEFQRQASSTDFRYLTGALKTVYGEYKAADPLIINTLMDGINPNHYRLDQIEESICWKTGDGTAVYQFYYGADSFAVLYVSAELGTGQYEINGL